MGEYVIIPRIEQLESVNDNLLAHVSFLENVRESIPKYYKPRRDYQYDPDKNREHITGKIKRLRCRIRRNENIILLLK